MEAEIICELIYSHENCNLFIVTKQNTLELAFFIIKYSEKSIKVGRKENSKTLRIGNKYQELEVRIHNY